MNEVAVIPPKPLTVIERAAAVFAALKSEAELKELAKSSATILTITNEDGKQQCHAARMVLKNTRLEIERTGEEGRDDAVKTSRAIIARQKVLIAITQPEEERLAAIQKAWDDRIAAEKERKIQEEIARVAGLQARIAELRGCQTLIPTSGSELIAEHIADLDAIPVDASFEEFQQSASDAKVAALTRLKELHSAALAHEAEQARIVAERAELAKLRAEQEARDKAAREAQAEEDRKAKAIRDAEAAAQAEANRLERERIAAEREAENRRQVESARKHAEELAAIRAENDRIARERADELDRQAEEARQANAVEAGRLAAERAQFEAEQAAIRQAQQPKPFPRIVERPTTAQLVACIAGHYSVSTEMATKWLRNIKWESEAA